MKKVFYFKLLFYICIGILFSSCIQERPPLDSELVNHYKLKKDIYQNVLDEVLSEAFVHFEILSGDDIVIRPLSAEKHVAEFDNLKGFLIEDLSVSLINTRTDWDESKLPNEVAFYSYRTGFVFAGESKGIVFVRDESFIKAVNQLDKVNREDKLIHGKRLYKKIQPHWYVFYEYFP